MLALARCARQGGAFALGALDRAGGADVVEPALECGDAVAGQAAVRLDLGLAGPPGADAADAAPGAEAPQGGPHASHAGHVVLELGELDLELALRRVGVPGEDVE